MVIKLIKYYFIDKQLIQKKEKLKMCDKNSAIRIADQIKRITFATI